VYILFALHLNICCYQDQSRLKSTYVMLSLRDHTIRYKNTRCKITEVVNANCSDCKRLRTISSNAPPTICIRSRYTQISLSTNQKKEKCLVHRIINVESLWPENYSLGYFKPTVVCSTIWYNHPQIGRYKSHCFYQPTAQIHENIDTIF